MNKISILIIGLLTCAGCCKSIRKAAPTSIEAVQTAAQVQTLLCSVDSVYSSFTVDAVVQLQDKRVERRYRQAGVKGWEKADIDGNGRTDLLVTGWWDDGAVYEETSQSVCLLDMGEGGLKLENFGRHFNRYGPIASIVWHGKQPLLAYIDFAPPILQVDTLKDEQRFLLTYKFGGFVEYNAHPTKSLVLDSITFTSDFAYDDVIIEKLTLSADGRAVYRSTEYPVLEVEKKAFVSKETIVKPEAMAQIKELVRYIDVDKLKPEYRVLMNHHPYSNLTLAYRNGRKVKVFDYGEEGTFGLMRLFALLRQLHKTQHWQPIKP